MLVARKANRQQYFALKILDKSKARALCGSGLDLSFSLPPFFLRLDLRFVKAFSAGLSEGLSLGSLRLHSPSSRK